MTWVVAASTVFGYGALYSDVQVTFRDGSTRDLVQKAYPVANHIAAGFAGSVKIGFMLIQSMMDRLHVAGEDPGTYAWDPVSAAEAWAAVAPSVFTSAELQERRLGSRILMVAASPTEDRALGAKIYFFRFADPDFRPQVMAKVVKICSIGSGSGIANYKQSIKPLLRLSSGLMQAEIVRRGGWGNHLGHSISLAVAGHPRTGIGRRMNTILVARDGFMFGTTNQTHYERDGTKHVYNMPKIARTYPEFLKLASASHADGTCAEC